MLNFTFSQIILYKEILLIVQKKQLEFLLAIFGPLEPKLFLEHVCSYSLQTTETTLI